MTKETFYKKIIFRIEREEGREGERKKERDRGEQKRNDQVVGCKKPSERQEIGCPY